MIKAIGTTTVIRQVSYSCNGCARRLETTFLYLFAPQLTNPCPWHKYSTVRSRNRNLRRSRMVPLMWPLLTTCLQKMLQKTFVKALSATLVFSCVSSMSLLFGQPWTVYTPLLGSNSRMKNTPSCPYCTLRWLWGASFQVMWRVL